MRFRLDFSRFITFFDPRVKSLVEKRRGQTRDQYRVKGISMQDLDMVRSTIDLTYSDWSATGSVVDWGSTVRTIQDRYVQRLEFIDFDIAPALHIVWSVRERCKGQKKLDGSDCPPLLHHTHKVDLIEVRYVHEPSERLIKSSIEEVQHEICQVISEIWIDAFAIEEETDLQKFLGLVEEWRIEVQKLMEWLDWPMWAKRGPRCNKPRETCYLPMWPWIKGGWGYYGPDGPSLEPKCIQKLPPYPSFLDDPI
ncbi:hypothetical protein BDM02DRAFT_3190382 [Thelephora ganbajun]|uniref:Uncharacterized protein n=1 Tax=Thelephora ganbajun TaxID=370292 RepID=A0ACB6Z4W2_THEGA|nr:hypothetical protein BDM02DRAFT_3190382 [Thelephora ganbajun]